jgi:hypothetical protein
MIDIFQKIDQSVNIPLARALRPYSWNRNYTLKQKIVRSFVTCCIVCIYATQENGFQCKILLCLDIYPLSCFY